MSAKPLELRKVRWLTADMNVAPTYTLDTVEAIVTHREVHIEGLLLTLKLMDGTLALERAGVSGSALAPVGVSHMSAARQLHPQSPRFLRRRDHRQRGERGAAGQICQTAVAGWVVAEFSYDGSEESAIAGTHSSIGIRVVSNRDAEPETV